MRYKHLSLAERYYIEVKRKKKVWHQTATCCNNWNYIFN